MIKTKILIVGPCQAGKSTIANFLSDATEGSQGDYNPTQGIRILEFEVNNVLAGSRTVTAEVELWDVSGDHKYEACWPAIAKDTAGVVFVFSPDMANYDKELEEWYDYMERTAYIKDIQCLIFRHHRPGQNIVAGQSPLPSSMSRLHCVDTSLDDDGSTIRESFDSYISTLLTAMADKSEKEELSILQS